MKAGCLSDALITFYRNTGCHNTEQNIAIYKDVVVPYGCLQDPSPGASANFDVITKLPVKIVCYLLDPDTM